MKCLNPYYTGIHLHKKQKNFAPGICVLILIILEYIYINITELKGLCPICVLILIILEYIYMFAQKLKITVWSLNPYYTGIHLHLDIEAAKLELVRS